MIDDKTALILEGGGMRGVFTCGVLDYLMDNHIRFPYKFLLLRLAQSVHQSE